MSKLVIVESPAKVKTIEKYLGEGYKVLPTIGHIRELPKKDAIDPDNNYAMNYVISPGKEEVVKNIKASAKKCDEIIIATDPDREGEAIAWHVADILNLDSASTDKKVTRAVFFEISKAAVIESVSSPTQINMDLVESQEARRALDRHFGFTLTPLLWRMFPSNNHSAGRVQSPALRMIVEKEKEIEAFMPDEYWTVGAEIKKTDVHQLKLNTYKSEKIKKFSFNSAESIQKVDAQLQEACEDGLVVQEIAKKENTKKPPVPFRLATIQIALNRKYGYGAKKSDSILQSLKDTVSITGDGYITYHRTESVNIAYSKIGSIRDMVVSRFGEDDLHEDARYVQAKEPKGDKEQHPALTPTDIGITPDEAKPKLNDEQYKVYKLIWERTVASQMKAYKTLTTSIIFSPKSDASLASFGLSSQEITYPGYLKLTQDEVQNNKPLNIKEGEVVEFIKLLKEQHFTQHPPRYNDASMIKLLEEKGIGRPSTYSSILPKLVERKYIYREKNGRSYRPSDMGRLINDFLDGQFNKYISDTFTAEMESDLDSISKNEKTKKEVLDLFWEPFLSQTEKVGKTITRKDVNPQRPLGQHPESAKPMFARMTKNGPAIQIGDIDSEDKLEWASLKEDQSLFAITLEDACALFEKQEDNVLGHHPESGEPIIARIARYGPTIQLGTKDNGNKPRYIGLLPSESIETLTLERALDYLDLPKELGKDPESGESILVTIGPYGAYFKRGSKNFRGWKSMDPFSVSLEEALKSIASSRGSGALKTFENSSVKIVDGRWGAYVTNGKKNASIPKDKDPESLELSDCLSLLEKAPAKKRGGKKSKAAKS